MVFALLSLAFVSYLVPGLFGAPLKMLSGVLPPTFYTINWSFGADQEQHLDCPNGLSCYHDYDEALQVANKEDKPLLIDFTGWSCVNCRSMEQNVWSARPVDSLIRNEFILVSLYVDSRVDLPENKVYKDIETGKIIDNYGEKWASFEIKKFGEFTQPLHVIVDNKGNQINEKTYYPITPKKYETYLLEALSEYRSGKEIVK